MLVLNYLNFSDAAKFAGFAKNLVLGNGYGGSFDFFSPQIFSELSSKTLPDTGVLPLMPLSIAGLFKIFGIGDFSVIATSFLYFLISLVFIYLLGKKIFNSKLVGALSAVVVGFDYDILHYALSGASEPPFIFEITAALYFTTLKKIWADVLVLLFFILMYFTRQQSFIYIAGVLLFWLLIRFKNKKATTYFLIIGFIAVLFDYFVLRKLPASYFYSVTQVAFSSGFNQSSTASNMLRGGAPAIYFTQILKNIFYNLYNFYKLIPQIMSPYLFALFVIGLFRPSPKAADRQVSLQGSFKVATVFMVVVTLLVTAASIPFYRYLHPVVPLIYIIAVGTLVEIINKFQETKLQTTSKLQKTNHNFLVLASCILVLIFVVGQSLGIIFLDSRFEANTHNVGKPPVYVVLSQILKANTNPNQVIITNLDTWGTWYGERKTVWFPLEPKQLTDSATGKIPFDAIYLTSYLIDDQNYYMGTDWRMIFNNPNDPKKWTCDGCPEIAKEFLLKGVYKVNSADDFEKQDATGILLIKK